MTAPLATWADYVSIARLDHVTKHIFILPGFMVALLLRGRAGLSAGTVLSGLAAAFCIACANYVINEWLDRDTDRFHPLKSGRTAVRKQLCPGIVVIEWSMLLAAGLLCASLAGTTMLCIAGVFAAQGVVYNVRPLRTKDLPFVDVVSESINNPLRLMIGWAMVDPATLPPSSILLLYWTGGAFLMAAKRLSEFRDIVASHGKGVLARYRASFAWYSEASLTASCFVYALLSSFFLAIFLVKYRIEYLLTVPVIIALFTRYLVLSMLTSSLSRNPENLFHERGLVVLVALLAAVFALMTLIDVPALEAFTDQRFIAL